MNHGFLKTIVGTAFGNLRISPLRTALALAGITIGAGAIVSMLQIGLIAERQVLAQLAGAGIDLMVIEPGYDGERITPPPEGIDLEAAFADRAEIDDAAFVRSYSMSIVIDGKETFAELIEAGKTFAHLAKLELAEGTFESLNEEAATVAIGPSAIQTFEGDVLPLEMGGTIRIGFDGYRVVGTFRDHSYNGIIGLDTTQSLIMPSGSLERVTKTIDNWRLILKLRPEVEKGQFRQQLLDEFQNDYGRHVDIIYAEDLIRAEKGQRRSLTFLLAAMGGVSLLVGTVGVTNVMLASVAERRKEIGLRMAMGAAPSDILLLFLTEATVLCLLGGMIGTLLGILASNIYANVASGEVVISSVAILFGLAASTIGGIAAGLYPAYRSAKLDPVKALQSE